MGTLAEHTITGGEEATVSIQPSGVFSGEKSDIEPVEGDRVGQAGVARGSHVDGSDIPKVGVENPGSCAAGDLADGPQEWPDSQAPEPSIPEEPGRGSPEDVEILDGELVQVPGCLAEDVAFHRIRKEPDLVVEPGRRLG
jgi:hypothetical protein